MLQVRVLPPQFSLKSRSGHRGGFSVVGHHESQRQWPEKQQLRTLLALSRGVGQRQQIDGNSVRSMTVRVLLTVLARAEAQGAQRTAIALELCVCQTDVVLVSGFAAPQITALRVALGAENHNHAVAGEPLRASAAPCQQSCSADVRAHHRRAERTLADAVPCVLCAPARDMFCRLRTNACAGDAEIFRPRPTAT